MRRGKLPADTARLRVERREPPLRLVRRIEDIGQRLLATEKQSTRRRRPNISLDRDVRAPIHRCHVEQIRLRAERRAVPFNPALDTRAKVHHMVARERHVHVLASGRRRLRKERKDRREIGWRRTTTYPRTIEDREQTVFVRRR